MIIGTDSTKYSLIRSAGKPFRTRCWNCYRPNRAGRKSNRSSLKSFPRSANPVRLDAGGGDFEFVQMKMSREGREGGEGFFMDKIFDRSKINL